MATPAQPQWDDASARSFYLEQLKLVRAEADKFGDESRITERYVLGACGAIYTFVLTQWALPNKLPYAVLLWIPVVLALWGGARCYALYTRIKQCAEYLKGAETTLRVQGWEGWEHWLNNPKRIEHVVANTAKAIWILLMMGTIIVAVVVTIVSLSH